MANVELNDTDQIKWGDGTNSSVGEQIRRDYYHKQALIEAVREQYFQPMASTRAMPKHYGKSIKQYHMMPLLDDRNVNDEGIDAAGAVITGSGNLYGSSKDIGTIKSKLPNLSETGGRVNRVGYHRLVLEATLQSMGMFHEFTKEALDFDTMDDLYSHLARELVRGASELTEDVLQMDLLAGAGVLYYGGSATSRATMTGEGATVSTISYEDLQRLSIQLDDNRTPKTTKILTGSRMIDTVTVGHGRLLYIGSELQIQLEKIKDAFDNKAFVPVEQYAYSGDYKKGLNMVHGEIGKIGQFRLIVVPEMQHWAGAGATATGANLGYKKTDVAGTDKYDVFPMLCLGSECFTTVGFQTSGKSFKFKIITKMPGEGVAQHNDPFGRTGFSSIQWYYGTMILRPERLAVAHTVAEQ